MWRALSFGWLAVVSGAAEMASAQVFERQSDRPDRDEERWVTHVQRNGERRLAQLLEFAIYRRRFNIPNGCPTVMRDPQRMSVTI